METRGQRNHNPLNIRKNGQNKWQGKDINGQDAEFETFINDAYGFRAAFRIIHNGFKATPKRDTIRKIIERWAPESDRNDTQGYINIVSNLSRIAPDTRLVYHDVTRMVDIVRAMAYVETGHQYDERVVLSGYNLEK